MSRGINKVILIGHLGQDPELRALPSGMSIANLSIATTESWTDKQSGEKKEQTEWHRVTLFGRTAEVAGEYLKKGAQVYIEGKLRTRKWQDKEGKDRWTTDIAGQEMQMIGTPRTDGAANTGGQQRQQAQSKPAAAQTAPAANHDFDDDIPF